MATNCGNFPTVVINLGQVPPVWRCPMMRLLYATCRSPNLPHSIPNRCPAPLRHEVFPAPLLCLLKKDPSSNSKLKSLCFVIRSGLLVVFGAPDSTHSHPHVWLTWVPDNGVRYTMMPGRLQGQFSCVLQLMKSRTIPRTLVIMGPALLPAIDSKGWREDIFPSIHFIPPQGRGGCSGSSLLFSCPQVCLVYITVNMTSIGAVGCSARCPVCCNQWGMGIVSQLS